MMRNFDAIEKVEGNDELLVSILILLPPKLVFKLMLVSKRWYHIFDQPTHRRTYLTANAKYRQCMLGFIHNGKILPLIQPNDLNINPIIPSECGEYVNSSNGLILCMQNTQYYHVLNPLTRARFSFTGPVFLVLHIGFACLENSPRLAPSFKVVGIVYTGRRTNKASLRIGTYSSETRKWTRSTLIGQEEFEPYAMPPFVCNGVFHWRAPCGILAVYDSNGDENWVQLIKLPDGHNRSSATLTRSSQDDVLWVAKYRASCICLWMLPKDEFGRSYRRSTTIPEKEWVLVHTVDEDYLLHKIMSPSRYFYMGGLVPGNPTLAILSTRRNTYVCNLKKKSIMLVHDSEIWHHGTGASNWLYFYTGPISLYSYTLSSNSQRGVGSIEVLWRSYIRNIFMI